MEMKSCSKKRKHAKSQSEYKKKYRKLKRIAKMQVYLNAALYDEIQQREQEFLRIKSERKFLLKKLFQYLPMTESQVLQSTQALRSLENSHPGQIPQTFLSPVQPTSSVKTKGISTKNTTAPRITIKKGSTVKSKKSDSAKRKRNKPGSAVKRVQPIHLDDTGVPLFPITLGTLTVYDLGEVVSDKRGFHSERYIWPVGYCSTRIYPSMLDPDRRIQYFCYIKDGGAEPVFEVIPEDEPDKPITAVTATACHCIVLKRLNKARGKEATNTGSGPEFFGFSHSTIQYLIQCLRGADQCEKYQKVKFEMPSSTSSIASDTVIHAGNEPKMENYDRSTLELPDPSSKMDME